jgi:serine/threonine protein kinase/formylglycine-generating enzyme required for sulfatase activity
LDPIRRDMLFAILAFRKGRLPAEALADCLEKYGRGEDLSLFRLASAAAGLDPAEAERLLREAELLDARGKETLVVPPNEEAGGLADDLALPDGEPGDLDLEGVEATSEEACTPPAAAPAESRYVPGAELGRGGLGRVLAAVDRILGREVAVKEMLHGAADPALLERFLREGRIAGRLMHPNIVPVYDVGVREDEGARTPYFVMGRIEGRDLAQILHGRGEDLSRQRLLGIFQDVCLAVAYAHDHGVIHRDLKPANVMVGRYGEVYVVDWGLAKLTHEPDSPDGASRQPDPPDRSPAGAGDRASEAGVPRMAGEPPGEPRPASDPESAPPAKRDQGNQGLTEAGAVLGTPNYMPPEQARGLMAEVDERSDIYSLGAILYEILTFHPPYEGPNKLFVLAQVLTGELKAPAARVSEVRSAATAGATSPAAEGGAGAPAEAALPPRGGDAVPSDTPAFVRLSGSTILTHRGEASPPVPDTSVLPAEALSPAPEDGLGIVLPDAVPPDLEEIVLKAMAHEKKDRYASAREIHEDVQRFLEGEKERERNRRNAARKVAEGRELLAEVRRAREALKEIDARIAEKREQIQAHWPPERKRELWTLEARSAAIKAEIVRAFTQASTTLQATFEFEPGNRAARAALADMFWDQFLREEEAGDSAEMVRNENLVREYNDGQYDSLLKGDGTLAVETSAYPCPCLSSGRDVLPAELAVGEIHPLSGRNLRGLPGSEGLQEFEPRAPLRLRVHAASCRRSPVEGADAWIFGWRESDRLLLPVCPDGPAWSGFPRARVPESVLDRCFEPGSPFRPGQGIYLGKTPVRRFPLPMGSYLVIAAREGARPVRASVRIDRVGSETLRITLFREDETPAGFAPIPAGSFVFQGDRETPHSRGRMLLDSDDFFVRIHQVTCREYLDFLRDLAARDPALAGRRVPRRSEGIPYWPRGEDGRFVVPTREWIERAPPSLRAQAQRLQHTSADWEDDWPVMGVSWEDAVAYADWERKRNPFLFRLLGQAEWEKAARGADGRAHPWGHGFDDTFCNMSRSFQEGMRPVGIGRFPTDESPYGIRGMGGNASDAGLDDVGSATPGWRYMLGGSWGSMATGVRAAYRVAAVASSTYPPRIGIRLCAPVKLEPPPLARGAVQ